MEYKFHVENHFFIKIVLYLIFKMLKCMAKYKVGYCTHRAKQISNN